MHEQIRQGIKDQVVEVVPSWSLPDLAGQVYSTYVVNGEPGWSLQTCAGSLSLPISCERLDVEAHLLYLGLKLCLDCIRSALCASLLPCKGENNCEYVFVIQTGQKARIALRWRDRHKSLSSLRQGARPIPGPEQVHRLR